jgi:hypothetical protein
VKQGCPISPTLFNIYINEFATTLEESAPPGLILHNTEIQFLLYADDLVLRSGNHDHKYKLYLDTVLLEHTKNDMHLGQNISNTGSFHTAVNELRDKARRAF